MSDSSNNIKLLSDFISGKKEAWDMFVIQFSKLIYYSVNKTVKLHNCNLSKEDVEDIFNSIFASFMENDYRKLRQFEGKHGCSLSSWIRLISIRQTIDVLRAQKNLVSLDDDSGDHRPLVESIPHRGVSHEKQLELSDTQRALKRAMEFLPSSDRLFITLYYEKELPPEEVAGIMNVSVNTIYSRKSRVQEKLKKILIDEGGIARN
jgi:RNA polymerase sigma-70 factor (ECF subfamily)